ncbi:hypothetical protein Anapl_03329 [Anas platyrhynchos]|uniref:Uncharacterized protein n=1 Tax=Anas platyrhynchos TaxID=8839 RepID=R0LT84_ANAPL|nr:hypothetical protein Anapl_03329 [Anas platyrhynchos]
MSLARCLYSSSSQTEVAQQQTVTPDSTFLYTNKVVQWQYADKIQTCVDLTYILENLLNQKRGEGEKEKGKKEHLGLAILGKTWLEKGEDEKGEKAHEQKRQELTGKDPPPSSVSQICCQTHKASHKPLIVFPAELSCLPCVPLIISSALTCMP